MIIKKETNEQFSFLGISQKGEAHIKNSKTNQDALEFFAVEDCCVLVVSDGLGSCEKSQTGAQYATIICKQILLDLSNNDIEFSQDAVINEIADMWNSIFPKEIANKYAATLKAVFINAKDVIAVSIGDGILAVETDNEIILSPDENENFANETSCLVNGVQPINFWSISKPRHEIKSILCCTDGIASSITQGREKELIREIAKQTKVDKLKKELLFMIEEISKYNTDDKTIGVVQLCKIK